VTADAVNQTGTMTLDGTGAVLAGNVTNAADLASVDGTITGALTNTGAVEVTGGDLDVNSFSSLGTITVTGGNTLTAAAGGAVGSTGTLVVNG